MLFVCGPFNAIIDDCGAQFGFVFERLTLCTVKKFVQLLEKRFGPLGTPIGNGDSGKVYRVAHPDQDGSMCALKVPIVPSSRAALKQEFDRARLLPPHEQLIQYLHIEYFQAEVPYTAPPLFFGETESMEVDPPMQTISATPTGTSHLHSAMMSQQPSNNDFSTHHFGFSSTSDSRAGSFASAGSSTSSHGLMPPPMTVFASPTFNPASASVAVLLELATGGSLLDRVKVSAFPEDELRYITRDILEGLKHIHSNGYMHLDIKPANIFLTDTNRAKIGDFGRLVSFDSYAAHSTPEGDSTYLAPEIYGDLPFPVHAPDVFSLAITILECATNLEIPRSGSFDSEGYQLLRNDLCPEQFLRDMSPELQSMLLRMLSRDPNARPSADQLLHDDFFACLPPATPEPVRRKVRSTSSPLTPYLNVSTPVAIASSAPSNHNHFLSSRVAMSVPHTFGHHRLDHSFAPEESPVRRRIYFPPDTD